MGRLRVQFAGNRVYRFRTMLLPMLMEHLNTESTGSAPALLFLLVRAWLRG